MAIPLFIRAVAGISLLTVVLLAGCGHFGNVHKALPTPTPVSTSTPSLSEAGDLLLDRALGRLNRPRTDLTLPRFEETYYRLVGRFPLIDQLEHNPLAMPDYVKTISARISKTESLKRFIENLGAAMLLSEPGKEIDADSYAPDKKKLKPLWVKVRARSDLETLIAPLIADFAKAMECRNRAIAGLSEIDAKVLTDDLTSFFYEAGLFRFMTTATSKQYAIMQAARKVNLRQLYEAERMLAALAMRASEALIPLAANLKSMPDQLLFDAKYDWGRVIVGGAGSNRYESRAALLIDLGGDDIYLNNPATTSVKDAPISLLVDLSGDDRYVSETAGSIGFGLLGASLLADFSGDDRYISKDYSQGVGYVGVGVIWDGSGNDAYRAGKFAQACGLFGIGGIADMAGDDVYEGLEMNQGFGSTLGLGLLFDREGADRYVSSSETNGFAQGSGCGCRSYPWYMDYSIYGGAGILIDDAGDDSYLAGSFSQGASYFLSMGALVDRAGNDSYRALGSYSHGGGVHLTCGCLIDESGDDIYVGQWAGNAVGNDRSAGIFIDEKGNDRYYAPDGDGQGYSHKPLGFSLFIDASGDDVYDSKAYSQAYSLPPSTPDAWSDALFVDLEGRDFYSLDERKNDSEWILPHAVGIDLQSAFRFENFFPSYWMEYINAGAEGFDPFELFRMIDELLPEAKSDPGAFASHLEDDVAMVRRAVEEAMTIALLSQKPADDSMSALVHALKSPDPLTRAYAVMTIDQHEYNSCKDALLNVMDESDPYVRKMIYRAIGNLKTFRGHIALSSALRKETDPKCKGFAIMALAKFNNLEYEVQIRDFLKDENEFVRMMAATALGRLKGMNSGESLLQIIQDPSPYVRKAAGESLLQLGRREGLKPMIEYLNYRALDTSSDNYGSNLGATLMEYANVDFGRDYQKWTEWVQKNGEIFDLDSNLIAREKYLEALKYMRNLDEISAMERFEESLKLHPHYMKARIEYAAMLNTKAWNMVTSPVEKTDLEKGLTLARRCVELDPKAMYLDTLAEACLRNGLKEEALENERKAIQIEPDNEEYQNRLKQMQQTK